MTGSDTERLARVTAERDALEGSCQREIGSTPCPYCMRGVDEPGHAGAALSWNGFVIAGNKKSVDEVMRLMRTAQYVESIRRELIEARAVLAAAAPEGE